MVGKLKMKRIMAVAAALFCLLLVLTACSAANTEQENTAQSQEGSQEETSEITGTVLKTYDTLETCKAEAPKDIEEMNAYLKDNQEMYLSSIGVLDPPSGRVSAVFRRIDKDKYIVKEYPSYEAWTAQADTALSQINAQAGEAYAVHLAERIPLSDSFRIYFKKAS